MALKNSTTQYGSIAKSFHWLIFFLVFAAIPVGFFMGDIANKALKGNVYTMHKSIGLLILSLVLLRLLWKKMNPTLQLKHTAAWERIAEHTVHFLLYFVLLAMPLSGWLMSTAAGYPPNVFWLGEVAMPGIQKSEATAELFAQVHEYLAWTLIVLVTIHVLAALKHHYIDKDTVLKRMMPGGE